MNQSEASIVLTVCTVGEGEALVYPQLDQRVQDPRDGRGRQGHGGAVLRRRKNILQLSKIILAHFVRENTV